MDKLIVTVAPTGNVPTRDVHPYVPLTPDEIAESEEARVMLGLR